MPGAFILGGLEVTIPDTTDLSHATFLQLLVEEYLRVIKTFPAPQGAFQHIVLLRLELEFEYIIEEHTAIANTSGTTPSGATPWSKQQMAETDGHYVLFVEETCGDLLQITNERIKHKRRLKRRYKTTVDDLIIARLQSVLNDAFEDLESYLEGTLAEPSR